MKALENDLGSLFLSPAKAADIASRILKEQPADRNQALQQEIRKLNRFYDDFIEERADRNWWQEIPGVTNGSYWHCQKNPRVVRVKTRKNTDPLR